MLIALLLQVAIALQPSEDIRVRVVIPAQDADDSARRAAQQANKEALDLVLGQALARRAACGDGMIRAGVAPGTVYRGEPVRSHPPIHVPDAYPDEGIYAAVVRMGLDGCMIPVPIHLPNHPKMELRPRVR